MGHRITETGEELKWCYRCKQWLLLPQFFKDKTRGDGLQSICRGCGKVRRDSYYAAHVEEKREYELKRRYTLSQEDYDGLFVSQGGVCAICDSPPNSKALHVDHNHATGKVRGLLCDKCNRGLGYFNDNPNFLRIATRYLEKEGEEQDDEVKRE